MRLGEYKVTIINGSYDHLTPHFPEGVDYGANLKTPVIRDYGGVSFFTLPTPYYKGNASLGRLKNMWQFYSKAMNLLSPAAQKGSVCVPDLIIGSTVHPLAAYAGYKLSRIYNVPFIYEVRDLWPQTLVDFKRISSKHPLVVAMNFLDHKMAKEATLVVTTAPLMKEYYIKRYHISATKFLWITNGTSFLDNIPLKMRRIDKHTPIKVGYTGALGYANGLLEFLEALSKVPETITKHFSFTFVGNGPLKNTLQNYVKENNIDNVIFANAVPKDKVWDTLESFDMLLFSLVESPIFEYGISPNKLADYHAVGRPIIEIVKSKYTPVMMAESGYHTDNVQSLASVFSHILNDDSSVYQAMGNNARRFAEANYRWEHLGAKLNQSFTDITGRAQ